jgi:hypothetical protein
LYTGTTISTERRRTPPAFISFMAATVEAASGATLSEY